MRYSNFSFISYNAPLLGTEALLQSFAAASSSISPFIILLNVKNVSLLWRWIMAFFISIFTSRSALTFHFGDIYSLFLCIFFISLFLSYFLIILMISQRQQDIILYILRVLRGQERVSSISISPFISGIGKPLAAAIDAHLSLIFSMPRTTLHFFRCAYQLPARYCRCRLFMPTMHAYFTKFRTHAVAYHTSFPHFSSSRRQAASRRERYLIFFSYFIYIYYCIIDTLLGSSHYRPILAKSRYFRLAFYGPMPRVNAAYCLRNAIFSRRRLFRYIRSFSHLRFHFSLFSIEDYRWGYYRFSYSFIHMPGSLYDDFTFIYTHIIEDGCSECNTILS